MKAFANTYMLTNNYQPTLRIITMKRPSKKKFIILLTVARNPGGGLLLFFKHKISSSDGSC